VKADADGARRSTRGRLRALGACPVSASMQRRESEPQRNERANLAREQRQADEHGEPVGELADRVAQPGEVEQGADTCEQDDHSSSSAGDGGRANTFENSPSAALAPPDGLSPQIGQTRLGRIGRTGDLGVK
jgi:hypothetical protein